MVIVITYEVVARYFFNRPTIWAQDTAVFMFGYCGLLSGAWVLQRGEHINLDLVYNLLSPRGKAILEVISGLLLLFFVGLVLVYGFKEAQSSFAIHERRPTEWAPPAGHFKLMMPIAGGLLFLQGLGNWLRSLYRALTDKELQL